VDGITKAKIESLQREIRAWKTGEARHDLATLARRFQLDPMIVKGIAKEEGLDLDPQPKAPAHAASSSTDFIRVADVEEFGRQQETKPKD
jgi:hypothetical protein